MASSASKDEVWLYNRGEGVDKLLDYNCTASSQRTIRAFCDDTEFGRIITPVSLRKKPAALSRALHSLSVLEDISILITSSLNSEYDVETLFFSSLGSVSTISDCILRKLRGFLMVISLDCTKHELLEEFDKPSSGKPKEKLGLSNRKKKGRTRNTKKQNPAQKSSVNGVSHENIHKVIYSLYLTDGWDNFIT